MAGRAGRRGLDAVGTVVVAAWEDIPEEGELRKLLTGRATQLESRFRLTYSMILNLLRVEDLKARLFGPLPALQAFQPLSQPSLLQGREPACLHTLHLPSQLVLCVCVLQEQGHSGTASCSPLAVSDR